MNGGDVASVGDWVIEDTDASDDFLYESNSILKSALEGVGGVTNYH